jgi:murein L,D-transpeptidase YcbB/YkuD
MTAWTDGEQVYFYDDIYRRDKRLVQAKTSKRG